MYRMGAWFAFGAVTSTEKVPGIAATMGRAIEEANAIKASLAEDEEMAIALSLETQTFDTGLLSGDEPRTIRDCWFL